MGKWDQLADEKTIKRTVEALRSNGFEVYVAENGEQAKRKVLEIIPAGAEVMNMTSMTLEAINLASEITDSNRFNSVRERLTAMSETQAQEKRRLGAAPEWAIGSVHAVTEDGHLLIASRTGSQLPAYAYGAAHVIWVIGTQKIVRNTDEGIKRIFEHSFPLEDKRARKAYGVGSGVDKILIINKEIQQGRLTVILVKEKLGF